MTTVTFQYIQDLLYVEGIENKKDRKYNNEKHLDKLLSKY